MRSIKKFITGISALQFIQLLRFSVLLLIGIVFTRYYSKHDIGQYESMLFIASAVSFFWLRGILQTFLAIKDDNSNPDKVFTKSSDYFNSFLLLIFFSALAVLFLLIFQYQMQTFLNGNEEIPFYHWLLAYLFLVSPSYFVEYVFLRKNKPVSIVIYGIISYGLQFGLIVIPPLLDLPIVYAVKALVFVSGLRFLFLLLILKKYSTFNFSLSFFKQHFRLAYPLIISSLLSGSGQYIDGAIVARFFDSGTFAVFRYGAREFPLLAIASNALSYAMIPVFGSLPLKEALAKLKSNSVKLMHILFPLTALTLVFSNLLFPICFTSDFSFSARIFNVYLLLIMLRLVFPETILIGKQITKIFLGVSFLEIALNVALSLILVQLIGLIGIAYATILADLFERIILVLIVKHKLNVSLKEYVPIRMYIAYCIAFLLLYLIVDFVIFPFPF